MKIKCYGIKTDSVALKFTAALDEVVGELPRETILFIDSNVDGIYNFSSLGFRNIILPAGEKAKSFSELERNLGFLRSVSAERDSPIAAIGGGATCDSASFTASIYKRGMPVSLVPTTLVSQADAALGGKTALNFGGIKNVLGSFYQPQSVIVFPGFLASLSEERYMEGLSECLKTALVASPALFKLMSDRADEFSKLNANLNRILVGNCANIKMNIVAKDPYDRGLRRILNFGHTYGHAVEELEGIPHGSAVAIGMTFSLLFAEKAGLIQKSKADEIFGLFKKLILPLRKPDIAPESIFGKIVEDKKIGSGKLRFITIADVGRPVVVGISLRKFLDYIYDLHVAWENRIQ